MDNDSVESTMTTSTSSTSMEASTVNESVDLKVENASTMNSSPKRTVPKKNLRMLAASGDHKKRKLPQPGAKSASKKKTKSTKVVKRKKRRKETFSLYIYKLVRQAHPQLTISMKSMDIMNCFVLDTFEKLCAEANKLTTINKRQTVTCRDFQTAATLLLPGELAELAKNAGAKAVIKYNDSKNSIKRTRND